MRQNLDTLTDSHGLTFFRMPTIRLRTFQGLFGIALVLVTGIPGNAADGKSGNNGDGLAQFVAPTGRELPAILLSKAKSAKSWKRLRNKDVISAGTSLISLPGSRSQVDLNNGLRLVLWGELPEIDLFSPLLESVATLNNHGEYDLDVTLDHGRIVISNPSKDKATVRVRLVDSKGKAVDSWQVQFAKKGGMVGLELWGRYPPGTTFDPKDKSRKGPDQELYCFLLRGKATIKIEDTTLTMSEPPGPAMLSWNSRSGEVTGPRRLKQSPSWNIRPFPPFPKEIGTKGRDELKRRRDLAVSALSGLSRQIQQDRIEQGLLKALKSTAPSTRILAVRCLCALGDPITLIDALADLKSPRVRQSAIESLRHWIGWNADNERKLYDMLTNDKDYSATEARAVVNLLHTLSSRALARPETYSRLIDFLRQPKPAIRELAYFHLIRIVPGGQKIRFDAMGSKAQLDRAYRDWKKLIPEGKVPKLPRDTGKKPK